MRIFSVSCAQHIGWHFKKLWQTQSKREILEFGIRQKLEKQGVRVVDVNKVIDLDPIFQRQSTSVEAPNISANPHASNSDWHDEPCRIYHDHIVLLSGLNQSLNLTRTGLVSDKSLPEKLNSFKISVDEDLHQKLQQAILHAHALDAVQEKLPRAVDVKKPGWSYPREYGLSKRRRNEQLMSKMFHIMDTTLTRNGVDVFKNHTETNKNVKEVLQVSGEPMLFSIKANQLLCSKKPLEPYSDSQIRTEVLSRPLPSIYPLEPTISIFPQNVYRLESLSPVKSGSLYPHLNMAIFTLNMPFIKHQLSQLQARLLVHAFGTAACYAKQRFGKDVVDLPEPVVLNCVHTDSRNFIFGCLEVHSLDLNGPLEGRNLFWMTEPMPLFKQCGYVDSRAVLQDYNPQVIETLLSMYNSQLSS